MAQADSDAPVIFGASGDLAAKMLFSALPALSAAGRIHIPVVCLARQLRSREAFVDCIRGSAVRRVGWNVASGKR